MRRYTGGQDEWADLGYYFEVVGVSGASTRISAGGLPVDTRDLADYQAGQLPGAIHAPRAEILGDRDAFFARPDVPEFQDLLIYGAGNSGALHALAAFLEANANGNTIYLYSGGWSDWNM